MARHQQPKAADDLTNMDWHALLFNRPCPPPTWWVGEAIARRTSHIELRAAAAACLLAEPLGLEIGNPPFLLQVPRLALAWREAVNHHHLFLPIPDGMRTAVVMLMTVSAAVDCLLEPGQGGRKAGAAPLVPELWEARGGCVRLVKNLQAAGIPLSEVNYKLTPEERADLDRQVAAVHARRSSREAEAAAPAEPVRRKAEPRAKPAKRKPAAARAEEQPAAPAAPAPAPKTSFASWLE